VLCLTQTFFTRTLGGWTTFGSKLLKLLCCLLSVRVMGGLNVFFRTFLSIRWKVLQLTRVFKHLLLLSEIIPKHRPKHRPRHRPKHRPTSFDWILAAPTPLHLRLSCPLLGFQTHLPRVPDSLNSRCLPLTLQLLLWKAVYVCDCGHEFSVDRRTQSTKSKRAPKLDLHSASD
jgi:hypothetical protein